MHTGAHVYILSSSFRKLYIGVTTDLVTRVSQHKNKVDPNCHTARYNIDRLVYYESYALVVEAIRREKVLKGWLRARKLELIISRNPVWQDLSDVWGRPGAPFDETKMRKPRTLG